MGRRVAVDLKPEPDTAAEDTNGELSADAREPLTSAQRLAASSGASTEVAPEAFGREAKHFTEIRVLNRDVSVLLKYISRVYLSPPCSSCFIFLDSQVRIVLESVDRFNNLIGSVIYADGDTPKDLAFELVENVCLILFYSN